MQHNKSSKKHLRFPNKMSNTNYKKEYEESASNGIPKTTLKK